MNVQVDTQRTTTAVAEAAPQWTLDGFGPMSRIATSFGDVPAQVLRERDQVRTATGGFAQITKVERYVLEADIFEKCHDATPVLIRAGALGSGLPKQDVVVSPRQQIGVGPNGAGAQFHEAGALLARPGVLRKPEAMFTYTRIHCGKPVVVKIEGIWARIGN